MDERDLIEKWKDAATGDWALVTPAGVVSSDGEREDPWLNALRDALGPDVVELVNDSFASTARDAIAYGVAYVPDVETLETAPWLPIWRRNDG